MYGKLPIDVDTILFSCGKSCHRSNYIVQRHEASEVFREIMIIRIVVLRKEFKTRKKISRVVFVLIKCSNKIYIHDFYLQ